MNNASRVYFFMMTGFNTSLLYEMSEEELRMEDKDKEVQVA